MCSVCHKSWCIKILNYKNEFCSIDWSFISFSCDVHIDLMSFCSLPDSSQEYTDSTGIDVHEFLVNTLKNNPRYNSRHPSVRSRHNSDIRLLRVSRTHSPVLHSSTAVVSSYTRVFLCQSQFGCITIHILSILNSRCPDVVLFPMDFCYREKEYMFSINFQLWS